jgi:DNA-binding PadR family transcriptional regulator
MNTTTKLSPRQREFLSKLLTLCREAKAPVHYANVARVLDVQPVTAYEMLRLLEDKGLVRSETVRPQARRGRSIVVFSPTEKASALVANLAGDSLDKQEWEEAKTEILAALERDTDYRDLLDELLLRIPERKSPLLFAADMITAIILVLYELRDSAQARKAFSYLRLFGPPGWAVLYSLAGLSLALSLVEKANRSATSLMLSYSQQFREHLDSLTGGEKARLSDFVYEVLRALGF